MVQDSSFSFQIGKQKAETKTDCKSWGTMRHKWLEVPGCTKKYEFWLKFKCTNCKDYEKKK